MQQTTHGWVCWTTSHCTPWGSRPRCSRQQTQPPHSASSSQQRPLGCRCTTTALHTLQAGGWLRYGGSWVSSSAWPTCLPGYCTACCADVTCGQHPAAVQTCHLASPVQLLLLSTRLACPVCCALAGYFKANSSSSSGSSGCGCKSSSKPADWAGSLPEQQLSHYPPDAGPSSAPPAAGVVTLGAVPWVVNFNVPLFTADRAAAAAVARAVSTRGGGLKGVEVGAAVAAMYDTE